MIETLSVSPAATAVFTGAMIRGRLSDVRTMCNSNRLTVSLVGAHLVFAPLRWLHVQTTQRSALVAGLV